MRSTQRLYKYYTLLCYSLLLCVIGAAIAYIEWQRSTMIIPLPKTENVIVQENKHLSLKETCALLFAHCSHSNVKVVCYSYQQHNQIYQAYATLSGNYESVINFCVSIYEKFPDLQCNIESLRCTKEEIIEAKIVLFFNQEILDISNNIFAQRNPFKFEHRIIKQQSKKNKPPILNHQQTSAGINHHGNLYTIFFQNY